MIDKTVDDWMAFYIGKYLTDTMHLARQHHGSYLMLILAAFKNAGWLPTDDAFLATIAKCTPKEWKAERALYARFFIVTDERWTHAKVTKEWEKAQSLTRQRSEAGTASAAKRQRERNGRSTSVATGTPANGQRNGRHLHSQLQEPETSTPSVATSAPKGASQPGRGRLITEAWQPSDADVAGIRQEKPHLVGELFEQRMRDFRDWCAAGAIWSFDEAATWRGFMRKTKRDNATREDDMEAALERSRRFGT